MLEFTYFLAAELHMTVQELEDKMGNSEFMHWQAFYGMKAQREELAMKRARKR